MHTSEEIGNEIEKQIKQFQEKKKGIHISGGMDSAIVASYLPGAEAYTIRFLGGNFQGEELASAEYYTNYYGLNLHYVDISWDTVVNHVEPVMRAKAAPVNSIESQSFHKLNVIPYEPKFGINEQINNNKDKPAIIILYTFFKLNFNFNTSF